MERRKKNISIVTKKTIGTQGQKRLTGTETSIVEKTVSSTKSGNGNILVPEVLLGDTLNLCGGDGIDVSLDFSGSVSFPGGDHLSANL